MESSTKSTISFQNALILKATAQVRVHPGLNYIILVFISVLNKVLNIVHVSYNI